MKYEDIENANKQIRTMTIERKDKKTNKVTKKEYVEVNQRIKAFRMCYPTGTIETEIVSQYDDIFGNGSIIIKASIYYTTDVCEKILLGTGYAMEERDSSYINQAAFVENCETSAVGRALGMCGFGIDTAIASVEEINSVEQKELHDRLKTLAQIKKLMAQKKVLANEVSEHFGKSANEMNDEELLEVITWLEAK